MKTKTDIPQELLQIGGFSRAQFDRLCDVHDRELTPAEADECFPLAAAFIQKIEDHFGTKGFAEVMIYFTQGAWLLDLRRSPRH